MRLNEIEYQIPIFLIKTDGIHSKNAYDIVDRCRKQLLRERININTRKIDATKREYEHKRDTFLSDQGLSDDLRTTASSFLSKSFEIKV